MKSKENIKKDDIKDKYTKKIGFLKKIKLKFMGIGDKLKNNKILVEETSAGLSMIGGVILYGVLGALALSLFGVGFNILSILGIGSLLWLMENKFTEIITKVLGSINLVNIYN